MRNIKINLHKYKAYTLIEVLVVVAIVGILAAIAMPSFNNVTENSRMSSNTNLLVGALNLARIEAIKRSEHVGIAPTTGTDWSTELTVWVDSDRGADIDVTETVLKRIEATQGSGTFVNAASSVIFLSTGFASAATSFQLCDGRSGETGRTITVLISGRIRSTTSTCT